jgi:enamine deaminase RidA (YjgF/YER057c/UK114 family)
MTETPKANKKVAAGVNINVERQIYTTSRPWEEKNGFARAVRIGTLVETSLCSPAGPDGTILHPGDVYRQTQVSLAMIGDALRALGMGFEDVIKTRIYVADPTHWIESGRAHAEVFNNIRPALGWIYMSAFFHPDITVEVECTAYRAP